MRKTIQENIHQPFDPEFFSRRQTRNLDSAWAADALGLEELRIIPVLNGLLTFPLMQEAKLIRSRIALPFGSSIIVAARRMQ